MKLGTGGEEPGHGRGGAWAREGRSLGTGGEEPGHGRGGAYTLFI